MSKLFIMAGTKGGIGKSLIATLLADMAFDNKLRPVLFDCDNENHSLSNAYPENNKEVISIKVEMTGEGRKFFPLDKVVNQIVQTECDKQHYPGNNAFLLDMKAGTSDDTMLWLNSFPFQKIKDFGIETYIIGVVTAEIDSCMTLLPWIHNYIKDDMAQLLKFVIVKNKVSGSDFNFFQQKIEKILKMVDMPVLLVKFPDFGTQYQALLHQFKTTFGQVATKRTIIDDERRFGFMDEHRFFVYYDEVSKAFKPIFTENQPSASESPAEGK